MLRRPGRGSPTRLGAAVVLLTGFDRVALGVHYVSDVLAGWVVALAVLAGTARPSRSGAASTADRRPRSSEGVDPEAADEMSRPG